MRLLFFLSLFISQAYSLEVSYFEKGNIVKQQYLPKTLNNKKIYISKNCKACLAIKANACAAKKVRGIYKNGDFVEICLFKDQSSFIIE